MNPAVGAQLSPVAPPFLAAFFAYNFNVFK